MNPRYPIGPKSEWERQARAIARGEIKTTAADVPMLLEWLKDLNWPGADVIANYLTAFSAELREPIRDVLRSGDNIWIRWTLLKFADEVERDFWQELGNDLKHVAFKDDDEGANVEALYILAKEKLISPDSIMTRIKILEQQMMIDQTDRKKIEEAIGGMGKI